MQNDFEFIYSSVCNNILGSTALNFREDHILESVDFSKLLPICSARQMSQIVEVCSILLTNDE